MNHQVQEPMIYEIHVRGSLQGEMWMIWFDGMEIVGTPNGDTILRGPVADQSALYGLIARLRDLALTLISVQRVEG